jgi:hypothetical protein
MFIADPSAAAPLLTALESAATAQSPSRVLAKALAAIALGPESGPIPSFGVLAPADEGLQLILRGHVTADIHSDSGTHTLSGERALTWADETVREAVEKIVVGSGDVSKLSAHPKTDLRAGVVPGGGFVILRVASARLAPQSPPREPAAAAVQESLPAPQPAPVAALPPTVAAPAAVAPPAAKEILPETHVVKSADPAKPVVRQRPVALPSRAPSPKPAAATAVARAPIGTLTADGDEAVYILDRPYVIGRNPLIDKSVRAATASPIVLPNDPQISRVHAYITLSGGAVLVRDANTPGGTFVAAPGDETWVRVGDRPVELKPGGCLRIGQRILVYQKTSPAQ